MGARIRWTEAAILLVVNAVIQIEEQPGKVSRKWDRIAELVPPELRGRTWNDRRQTYNTYAFKRMFDDILKAYRDVTQNRLVYKGRHQYKLTSRIYAIMKKREELIEARVVRRAETRLKSGDRLKSVSPSPATSANFLEMRVFSTIRNSPVYSNISSSGGQSVGTKQAASSFFLKDATASESAEDVLLLDCRTEQIERDYCIEEKLVERFDEGCSLRSASVDPANQKKPATSSPSRSVSHESNDAENMEQTQITDVRGRAPARRQKWDSNSSTWRLPNFSRNFLSERKTATSTSYDEDLDANLDWFRGRVDLELSRLSSWMQSRLIPVGRKVLASFAIRSGTKRRKLNAGTRSEPVDELIYESLSKFADLGLRASFRNLRSGFAKMLEDTSVELTQELLQRHRRAGGLAD